MKLRPRVLRDATNRTIFTRLFFDWHLVSILVVVLLAFLTIAPWIANRPLQLTGTLPANSEAITARN